MAARAINGRFRALWGYEEGGFPTAAQVSKGKIEVLKGAGLSTRKAEYGQSDGWAVILSGRY